MCGNRHVTAYLYLRAILNTNVLELKLSCPTTHLLGTTAKTPNNISVNDAFEAVKNAREDVPYLHEHPFSLYEIHKEE